MFTRPAELSDTTVGAALLAGWGIAADSLEYAPVGFGSHHWRVTAGTDRWFVTVDDLAAKRITHDEPLSVPLQRLVAALATARHLADGGLSFVIAPQPAGAGGPVHRMDDRFVAAVYPHVDGTTHDWGPYDTRAELLAVVSLLVELHTAPPATAADALADTFAVHARDHLDVALGELHVAWRSGPHGEAARGALAAHATAVAAAIRRYDALVATVCSRPERAVLTHGEPHRGNTIDTADGVVLVDWDTTLLAPPERDLWSLADQDAAVLDGYTARTGATIDPDALALYRIRWPLTDVALSISALRGPHGDTEDTRAELANLRTNLAALDG